MMRVLLLIAIFVALCHGKPLDSSKDASILKFENVLDPSGSYKFFFETSDGTIRQETGIFKKSGLTDILVVGGYYSYLDTAGIRQNVHYIADENGYKILDLGMEPSVSNRIDPTLLGSLIGSGVGYEDGYKIPELVTEPSVSNRIDPIVLESLIGGGVG